MIETIRVGITQYSSVLYGKIMLFCVRLLNHGSTVLNKRSEYINEICRNAMGALKKIHTQTCTPTNQLKYVLMCVKNAFGLNEYSVDETCTNRREVSLRWAQQACECKMYSFLAR